MKKNILVLGASGMAGHTISLYMQEKGHSVTTFTRKPFNITQNNIIGDAFNADELCQTIKQGNFDAVINCIGLLNQDAENNTDKAAYLNAYLPHQIAAMLRDSKTKLIHMSTDCVFAGNTGPYYEDSLPDGATFYDRSKALGEVNDQKNLTFRNSIIGPDIDPNGIGLFNWFMKQTDTVNGYTKAMWTGVTTLTLAMAMEQAIADDLTGLYNLVNNQSISKFELLKLFNNEFKDGKLKIEPSDTLNLDKSLRTKRTDFNFEVPTYEQQIAQMKKWVDNHKKLYPHY